MSNNKILIIDAVNKNTFRLTILFLCLFLLLTIVILQYLQGNKDCSAKIRRRIERK